MALSLGEYAREYIDTETLRKLQTCEKVERSDIHELKTIRESPSQEETTDFVGPFSQGALGRSAPKRNAHERSLAGGTKRLLNRMEPLSQECLPSPSPATRGPAVS